jgi:hypothetical protein
MFVINCCVFFMGAVKNGYHVHLGVSGNSVNPCGGLDSSHLKIFFQKARTF